MIRKKRWAAKARQAERKAVRRGAPAATCPQCRVLRLIREPVYDGPLAVTHGRCSTCGRFIVQPDIAAHWRRVFAYGGPEEPKHWLERLVERIVAPSGMVEHRRLVSTEYRGMVVRDEESGKFYALKGCELVSHEMDVVLIDEEALEVRRGP